MEAEFLAFVKNAHPAVLNTLREKKAIDDELTAMIRTAIEDFKATRWESYQAETGAAKASA